MSNPFKEKMFDDKKKEEPGAMKLKKLDLLSDIENVEIKKLDSGDVDEVYMVMRKTLWESSREQVTEVIKEGMSYGAYVERMLVGAGLAWPAHYDEKKEKIAKGEPNAIYMEDVALLLAYEGRGIRKILVEEREKAGKSAGFRYAVAFISPDWPKGSLEDMIKERGNRIERAYLAEGYKFLRTKDGILAVKAL